MRKGSVVYSPYFKHTTPDLQVGYKAPRGRTLVFICLGDADKKDPDGFDAEQALRDMGWIPETEADKN